MSKRRVFDIGFPDDPVSTPVPSGTEPAGRRGPMAAAITENAEALRERAEVEARIRAENDALAHELVRIRKLGLLFDLIDIDTIRTDELIRDRGAERDDEIDELKQSIRDVGLSNPVRVVARGDGYQLIQGYRRLTAYRELLADTGDAERWRRIPAGLVAPGETIDGLYRRMVDENMVRRDISFAEMAELARAFYTDPETGAETLDAAIAALYGSAARQKRVYIRNFARLIDAVGDALMYPAALPRALGLAVWKRLDREPISAVDLRRRLLAEPDRSKDRELEILREFSQGAAAPAEPKAKPRKPGAKTTLRVQHGASIAQCTAADGRVELREPRDFSAIDRMRLERAVTAFLSALDD